MPATFKLGLPKHVIIERDNCKQHGSHNSSFNYCETSATYPSIDYFASDLLGTSTSPMSGVTDVLVSINMNWNNCLEQLAEGHKTDILIGSIQKRTQRYTANAPGRWLILNHTIGGEAARMKIRYKRHKPSQRREQLYRGWDICLGGSTKSANNTLDVKLWPITNGTCIHMVIRA
jgi:hypothetical protein